MTDWYISKFKKDRDIDTDPNWPDHTGVTVWVWGLYTLEEHRMGGVTARRDYKLYYGKRMRFLAICDGKDFNKKWLQEKIDEHKSSKRNVRDLRD